MSVSEFYSLNYNPDRAQYYDLMHNSSSRYIILEPDDSAVKLFNILLRNSYEIVHLLYSFLKICSKTAHHYRVSCFMRIRFQWNNSSRYRVVHLGIKAWPFLLFAWFLLLSSPSSVSPCHTAETVGMEWLRESQKSMEWLISFSNWLKARLSTEISTEISYKGYAIDFTYIILWTISQMIPYLLKCLYRKKRLSMSSSLLVQTKKKSTWLQLFSFKFRR